VTCKQYEIVVVPFPFTDRLTSKRRPAVALSNEFFSEQSGHTLLAMITGAKKSTWPSDIAINSIAAGLRAPSKVRLKLFTLDNRMIGGSIGALDEVDRHSVQRAMKDLLAFD
jgi:mRNA interferase MazF